MPIPLAADYIAPPAMFAERATAKITFITKHRGRYYGNLISRPHKVAALQFEVFVYYGVNCYNNGTLDFA